MKNEEKKTEKNSFSAFIWHTIIIHLRDIISIYGKKISELEYTRLQKDLLDLVKD